MALPICWCRATPRHSIHVLAELQLLVRHGRKRGLCPMTGKMWRVELLIGRRDIPKCEGSNPFGYKGQESGCLYIYIYMSVYIHTCAYNISDQCVWYTKYILILYLQISVCTWYIYICTLYISCTYIYIYIYVCVCVWRTYTHIHTYIHAHIFCSWVRTFWLSSACTKIITILVPFLPGTRWKIHEDPWLFSGSYCGNGIERYWNTTPYNRRLTEPLIRVDGC